MELKLGKKEKMQKRVRGRGKIKMVDCGCWLEKINTSASAYSSVETDFKMCWWG